MSTRIKIRGGTAQGKQDLCRTCSSFAGFKTEANTEFKFCNAFDREIKYRVVECSAYHKFGETSLYNMRQIAWHITPEVKERIGFKEPEKVVKIAKPEDKQHRHEHVDSDGIDDLD